MIPNRNCGERGRVLYEHEHEREGEARARMLIAGLGSTKARIALLVTRGYGEERESSRTDKESSRWHFPGRFLRTMILALCIWSD